MLRAYVKTENSFTFGREVTFNSPDKAIDPGTWSLIFDYQSATDWSTGCDVITVLFTYKIIHIYTVLSDGKLYCYSHNTNTLKYLSADNIYISGDSFQCSI